MPAPFVESVIAISICYVAAENILFPTPSRRWLVSFAFGLVHRFGFSTILRELDLPRAGMAVSLVFFNLGVEAGQVAIVLVAVPMLAMLARRPGHRRAVVGASYALLAIGAVWFIQRTFLH